MVHLPAFMVLDSGANFVEWMEACSLNLEKAASLLNVRKRFTESIIEDETKISLTLKFKCQNIYQEVIKKKK